MPLRHRHEYTAGFLRGLSIGDINRLGVPRSKLRVCAATQPTSVRLQLVHSLERRLYTDSLSLHLPSCLPDPSHLTVLTRPGFVKTACPLPPFRVRLSPTSPACCDRPEGVFHHRTVQGASWRTLPLMQALRCRGSTR